jgi:O-antigen/teichoic acid export membrane protein
MFGIWQVLSQLTAYSGVLDFKSGEVLKWSIAKDRESQNNAALNRHFSSAIYFQFIISPIILIIGGIVALLAPSFIGVSTELFSVVAYSISFLVFGLMLDKFFNLFESVLRGMNLGYKRMGLRAFVFIIGGFLQYIVVINGYGVLGLSIVNVLTVFLGGIILYFIVKRNFPWIGLIKFDKSFLKAYSIKTGWFSVWALVNVLLSQSDKIFLLKLSSPEMVSKLVMSFYLVVAAKGVVSQVLHGVIPGIGKYIGLGDFDTLLLVRNKISTLGFGFIFIFSTVIIGFNKVFVSHWIGFDLYAGNAVTLLLVFNFIQNFYISRDNVIINMFLDVKGKVKIGLIVWVVEVFFWILLIPKLGILGLLIGSVTGNFIMMIYFPILLGKLMSRKVDNLLLEKQTFGFVFVAFIVGLGLNYLCDLIAYPWVYSILLFVTLCILALVTYFLLYSQSDRYSIKRLIDSVANRIQ